MDSYPVGLQLALVLLAVDVGNTQTVLGLFDGEPDRHGGSRPSAAHRRRARRAARRPARARRPSTGSASPRRCRRCCASGRARGALGAGAAPVVARASRRASRSATTTRARSGPTGSSTPSPRCERYGAPCIVVDFGTSTNFDVVSPEGEFVGGVLAPGIEISMDALFARAARLVKVDFVGAADRDRQVDRRRLQRPARLRLRGPGRRHRGAHPGGARRTRPRSPPAGWPSSSPRMPTIERVDPLLTLEGLRLVWELNR